LRKLFEWEKGWKKKKKRGFLSAGPGTRFLAHPGRERALRRFQPSGGPRTRGNGAAARVTASLEGPLASERGGGNGVAARRRANRPSAGKNRPPGRLDGGLPPVARLLVRGGVLARAAVGASHGRFNLARGGREGAAHGEGAELRGGDRRRWALGGKRDLEDGASGSRLREGAARLIQFIARPIGKEREEEESEREMCPWAISKYFGD
jgi:hypothetical protein